MEQGYSTKRRDDEIRLMGQRLASSLIDRCCVTRYNKVKDAGSSTKFVPYTPDGYNSIPCLLESEENLSDKIEKSDGQTELQDRFLLHVLNEYEFYADDELFVKGKKYRLSSKPNPVSVGPIKAIRLIKNE